MLRAVKKLFALLMALCAMAACGGGDTTNVYTPTPEPSPSGSPTPTPSSNPYSGAWNNFEMKTSAGTGNGTTNFGQIEVDGAGDFALGLLGGTDDYIDGTIAADGSITGTFHLEASTCAMAGQCYSASFCEGTFTPICGTAQWELFALDRNN